MATVAYSSAESAPATLRQLLQRLPQVVDAPQTAPGALHAEPSASLESLARLVAARERFLKSAQSFLRPCLQEAVLRNLTRADDPLASPTFDQVIPDQTGELAGRKQEVSDARARVRAEISALKESEERVRGHEQQLREKLSELTSRADAASEAGLNVLDTSIAASADTDEETRADRQNEETLKEQAVFLAAAKGKMAARASEAAALRAALEVEQNEIAALESEQQAAAISSTTNTQEAQMAENSRQNEATAGVTDMADAEVEAAVMDEEARLQRNAGIRDWFKGAIANLEQIGGVKISVRRLSGFDVDGGEGGGGSALELMVDLGSSQVLEVTLSARDGSLGSVKLYASSQPASEGKVIPSSRGGCLTQGDVEELASVADTLPAPANLRLLVREALSRGKCAALRDEHVKQMRRRYLIGYRAGPREVTVTMPAGIVALFRLHADYPMVAGGAELVALAGVGGWSASETEQLCTQVNRLALATLMDIMDRLEEAVAALEG